MKAPVAGFKGNRVAYDTGVVFWDENNHDTVEWIKNYMDIFISGEFRKLKRWDDGYVFTKCAKKRGKVQDFAKGKTAKRHRNSNGHSTIGQIICQTKWNAIFEHDKGKHHPMIRKFLKTKAHKRNHVGDIRML